MGPSTVPLFLKCSQTPIWCAHAPACGFLSQKEKKNKKKWCVTCGWKRASKNFFWSISTLIFLFFLIVWQRRSIEGSNQWIKWRSDWTQFHYCEGVCSDSLFSLSLFHGALKLMVDVIRGQLLQHGLWCMRFWFCLAWPPTNVRSNISISHFVVVETSLYVSLTFIPLPRFSCLFPTG